MILTLTLNPAVDKTLTLENFVLDGMNRAVESHQDPGGKGINVSKVVHALGGDSVAMGFVGGATGTYIQKSLNTSGIRNSFVELNDSTRTNLKIFDKTTQQTIEVNESGAAVLETDLETLTERFLSAAGKGDVCVISGSVPKGVPESFYAELIKTLRDRGAIVLFDADGPLFRAGIQAKPDYIKPNRKELEAYFGRPVITTDDFKTCAAHFLNLGVGHVIFSLGSEGSFFMDSDHCYRVQPLPVEAKSSVGAGDAYVGALAFGINAGLSLEETLKLATATSAGAVTTEGTKPAPVEWVEAHRSLVQIEKLL